MSVVCNGSAHSTINTEAELAYLSCLGPDASCTWANDLDRTEGVGFIRAAAAKGRPFFLYLSSTTPHAGELHGHGPTPAAYSAYNPVPYPYNTKFLNETGPLWSVKEKMFAASVWAQDVMVGVDTRSFCPSHTQRALSRSPNQLRCYISKCSKNDTCGCVECLWKSRVGKIKVCFDGVCLGRSCW